MAHTSVANVVMRTNEVTIGQKDSQEYSKQSIKPTGQHHLDAKDVQNSLFQEERPMLKEEKIEELFSF